MSTIALAVADLQSRVRDPGTTIPSSYNLVLGEKPSFAQGLIYGAPTTLVFYLANKPVVANSIYITLGTAMRQTISQLGVSADYTNGILTFSTQPSSSAFYVDYNFNFFLANEYTNFLNDGLRFIGEPSATSIDELLAPAAYRAAEGFFYDAMASYYANRYRSSGGQVAQDIDVVTTNYRNLSKDAKSSAIILRDDYYKRQGQRNAPSSHFWNYGVGAHKGFPQR